jgi:hypothetical protein
LRVSSSLLQEACVVLDDTRNQPVIALPWFDHGRVSSFPPVHADRRTPPEGGLLPATDGALIDGGAKRSRVPFRAMEQSFDSRFSRSPPV